jgi:hypothetical protein
MRFLLSYCHSITLLSSDISPTFHFPCFSLFLHGTRSQFCPKPGILDYIYDNGGPELKWHMLSDLCVLTQFLRTNSINRNQMQLNLSGDRL